MITLVRATIAIVLALFFSSCGFNINFGDFGTGQAGNGNVVEEKREVTADFDTVHASEGIQVYVTQASDFSILVEGDDNIIDLIGTDIKNGKLRIHTHENIGRATKKVFVTLPEISALETSSGAHLSAQNELTVSDMSIDSSSGSMLTIAVNANALDIDASSGANLEISGQAKEVHVDGSSGAHIKATDLTAVKCRAEASSGSYIGVHVSQLLTADASSGGNIAYKGDPEVRKHKSVSGSVHSY